MDDSENFRRREDTEWRTKVDHEIVTLMTGYQVLGEQLKRLEREYRLIDRMLRGDTEKGTDGLMAAMHDVEKEVRKFNAVLFVDSTGKKGLLSEVKELQGSESKSVARWKFWTALAVAVIGTGGLLLREWGNVREFFIDTAHAYEHFTGKSSKKPIARNGIKHRRRAKAEPESESDVSE